MHFNVNFWRGHFRATLPVELEKVTEILEKRILPQFTNIEAEATEIQEKTLTECQARPSNGDEDPSEIVDAAFNAGLQHYSLMQGLSQGVVNLFAASLFHMHEQYLMVFYKRELCDPRQKVDLKKLSPSKAIARLESLGVNVKELPSWPRLKEVELLANTIKHGDGASAEELRKKRPEYFNDPNVPAELNFWPALHLDKPLLGEGVYVGITDISEIKQALVAFWEELFELLEEHDRDS